MDGPACGGVAPIRATAWAAAGFLASSVKANKEQPLEVEYGNCMILDRLHHLRDL